MPKTIKDIAEVSSGLVVARKKAVHATDAKLSYKQLNLRSINKNGYIEIDELEILIAKEAIDENYLTHEGDIIIRLTDPFTAVAITKENEGFVVSSNFCIVRCNGDYDSNFLSYYLNSDQAKKKLMSNTQGSIIKNISMLSICEMEVPNIPLEKQRILGKLFSAQTQKIIILNKIQKLEEKKQKAILDQLAEMEENND